MSRKITRILSIQTNNERLKATWKEMTHASRVARLLRAVCCCGALQMPKDRWRFRQLVKEIMQKVLAADMVNLPGERNVFDGNLALLQGFEFSRHTPLANIMRADFVSYIDRSTSSMRIYFPPFIPTKSIHAPQQATHFQLICVGAALNFEYYNAIGDYSKSVVLPINNKKTTSFSLKIKLLPGYVEPFILVLGITFYETKEGRPTPLFNGACQAVRLVEIDLPYSQAA